METINCAFNVYLEIKIRQSRLNQQSSLGGGGILSNVEGSIIKIEHKGEREKEIPLCASK